MQPAGDYIPLMPAKQLRGSVPQSSREIYVRQQLSDFRYIRAIKTLLMNSLIFNTIARLIFSLDMSSNVTSGSVCRSGCCSCNLVDCVWQSCRLHMYSGICFGFCVWDKDTQILLNEVTSESNMKFELSADHFPSRSFMRQLNDKAIRK